MSKKPALRVYLVELDDGRLLGTLMRTRESFFDSMPPQAYGVDLEDVLLQLERELKKLVATRQDELDRYLFTEEFQTRSVQIEVHRGAMVHKQPVVGARKVPLRLTYAVSETSGGYYRVMLPRFSWWLFLEDLESARDVLAHAVSSALLGVDARWVYEFRRQGEERVERWSPDWVRRYTEQVAEAPSAPLEPDLPAVEAVAEDWVERVAKNKLPKVIGNDPSFLGHAQRYLQETRPSLLLVGPRGVGKTTFVRRLARQLLRWKRAKVDAPRRLWSTSAERILAGMIYLGMWQKRCLEMVEQLDGEDQILYVGPLLPMLEPQSDGSSIHEFFAAPMMGGSLPMIAECTEDELALARRRAGRFVDAFTVVRIQEADRASMVELLAQRAVQLGLDVHPAALERMVRLLGTYSRHTRFPGKGFAMIERLATDQPNVRVLPADAASFYARFAGLPVDLISDERSATIEQIAAKLRAGVIGQDDACQTAAAVLARFKAGLSDPDKPLGNLLFVGPTGVGKTELAKQLARVLFDDAERMVRVDLSEFMVAGSAQRLRRVGRGVTSLAEQVHRQPLSLVLFDELEKAHPEVFDLLLGILGEGRLTDELGRLVDFRMTIVILTSNLGTDRGPPIGFGATERQGFDRAVREFFRPELTNRLDHVISFAPLRPEHLSEIVDLELTRSLRRPGIHRRRLDLLIDASARARLAELGHHPTRGARPLKRVIEERVFTPLAARIAEDPGFRERHVRVVAAGSAADLRLTEAERADAIVIV